MPYAERLRLPTKAAKVARRVDNTPAWTSRLTGRVIETSFPLAWADARVSGGHIGADCMLLEPLPRFKDGATGAAFRKPMRSPSELLP